VTFSRKTLRTIGHIGYLLFDVCEADTLVFDVCGADTLLFDVCGEDTLPPLLIETVF
jgi:hypothetical protein